MCDGASQSGAVLPFHMTQPTPARAVLLLAFAAFTSAAATRAVDPLLVPLAEDFGTTPGGASVAVTAFLLSYGPWKNCKRP